MEIIHVYPVNDARPHLTDGEDCPCNPRSEVVEGGNIVVTHNSWDGREYIERLREDLPKN